MSHSNSSPSSNRHLRVRFAALLYFVSRGLLLALLVAGPVVYGRYRITDLRLYGAAAGVVVLALLIAYFVARPLRCVACGQPVLCPAKQPKHPYASKGMGFSYRARVAWDILTSSHHHCMYCHTRCRNAGHSNRGTAMPVSGFARQETVARAMREGSSPIPAATSRPTIFDSAFLSSEASRQPVLPAAEQVFPTSSPPLEIPQAPFLFAAKPPLPPVTLPLVEDLSGLPVATAGEVPTATPAPASVSVAAPLPLSPFLLPSKPPVSEFSTPFNPSPPMTTPAPALPVFPFGSAVTNGPMAPAPLPAAFPMAPTPLFPSKAELPAIPLPLPSQVVLPTPSPFFPPIKPAAPASDAPFPAVSPSPPVNPAAPPLAAAPVPPAGPSIFLPPSLPVMESTPSPPPVTAPPVPFAPVAAVAPVLVEPSPAASALSMETVVGILEQGRQTMESAFLGMIGQLRAAAPVQPATPPLAPVVKTAPLAATLPTLPSSPCPLPVTDSVVFGVPSAESFSQSDNNPDSFNPFAEFSEDPVPPAVAPLAPLAPLPAIPPSLFAAPQAGPTPVTPLVYPPLHPVMVAPASLPAMPPLPHRPPVAFAAASPLPPLAPPANVHTAAVPVRRRPLPAINPDLLAELGPTLQQAFAPPSAPPAFPAPMPMAPPFGFPSSPGIPGSAFPPFSSEALPVPAPFMPPAPPSSPVAFPLPPMAVPPGNSFAPTPGPAFAAPAPAAPPDSYSDAPAPVPAPFSFLQAVTPPSPVWPTDEPADFPSAADSPPMWTRTRGKSSLS